MAARFWSGNATGTSPNWNYNSGGLTNWGSASGVADNVAVPGVADDVTFDGAGALGNSNSTISATISCKSLTITAGYTATMTHNAVLTIAGNWNYANSFTIAGSSSVTVSATSTITSNGKTWPNSLTFSGAASVKTLSGNFIIGGVLSLTWGTSGSFSKTTSETFTCAGVNCNAGSNFNGTVEVIVTSGSITGGNSLNVIGNPITLLGGAISLGNINFGGGLLYISGTISPGASTIVFGSGTFDTNGITWGNISIRGAILLSSNLTVPGILTIDTAVTATINKTTSETVTAQGNLVVNVPVVGTAKIILTGGTWSGSNTTGVANDVDLQGNITISTNVYYRTGTLKYVSGALTLTSSTLNLTGTCTLDTDPVTWPTVTLTNTTAQTYTINSLFSISGTLTLGTGATTIFSGTAGWTCATLSNASTAATTITLKEAITYTVTTLLSCFTTRTGSSLLFTSAHGTTKANLTLSWGATCRCLSNFTRIDASGGRPIRAFNSTITDCSYIQNITDLKTNVG